MAALPNNSNNSSTSSSTAQGDSASSANSANSHKHTNKLINEQSPYLLQHAHNPVDWHPWGQEAFNLAQEQKKPIFLSVGYSTCHWCHVMEHESFENEEVAALMNKEFVSIKVDREERPDVDKMYMTYVQATSGHGGWPMSVWLTPQLKPIFGGTYFPRDDGMYGSPGFKSILKRVASVWKEERPRMEAQADRVISALQSAMVQENDGKMDDIDVETGDKIMQSLYQYFYKTFDNELGGFGNAPKFPRPSEMNALLRFYYRNADSDKGQSALNMVLRTLRAMGRGGMFDQLGFGFHRYSVDEYWHVPHFEKMLYDNAQLIVTYLNAYQITKDSFFREIACKCLEYIIRDMTDPCGAIWSAEDADSYDSTKTHKKEGLFYIWTEAEIDEILGGSDSDEAVVFKYCFMIKKAGNTTLSRRSDPHREFTGQNVLYARHTMDEVLKYVKEKHPQRAALQSLQQVEQSIESARKKLFEYRNNVNGFKRHKPDCDDKVIVAWNGLMISAFARAHQVLRIAATDAKDAKDAQQQKNGVYDAYDAYLRAGANAAKFLYENMRDKQNGRLYRIYRKGVTNTSILGFSSDYSYLIQGLLDLYEAGFDPFHLQWAMELQSIQIELFYDAPPASDAADAAATSADASGSSKKRMFGGFFESLENDEHLLIRSKEDYDGAEPSSTSVAVMNLLRLSKMTGRSDYRDCARHSLRAMLRRMEEMPMALPQCAVGLDSYVRPSKQIVLSVYDGAMSDTLEMGDEQKQAPQQQQQSQKDEVGQVTDLCKDNEKLGAFCKQVFANFYPDVVLLVLHAENKDDMVAVNEELKWFDCSVVPKNVQQMAQQRGQEVEKGDVFAHVCDQFRCKAPTNNAEDLEALIQNETTTFEK